jgi:hypothetical protein
MQLLADVASRNRPLVRIAPHKKTERTRHVGVEDLGA